MKTIHYGEDYCKVVVGKNEYELPIAVGKAIDRQNKKNKALRKNVDSLRKTLKAYNII